MPLSEFQKTVSSARFDVAPGDHRFLMIRTIADAPGRDGRDKVVLVTNLVEQLKRKAGTKK